MKKINYKKSISLMLAISMLLTTGLTVSAESPQTSVNIKSQTKNINRLVVTDSGVTINGIYYSKIEFNQLLNKAVKVSTSNKIQPTAAAAAAVYFIPGIGQIAIAATGAIIIGGVAIAAGTWLYDTITSWLGDSTAREIASVRAKIPSRLRDDNGDVDLGKFDQKVNGKTAYKEKGGWSIDKDNAGHGGRKWKLKDKSGDRVASLGEKGEVLGK
ncbi:hypothetical protein ABE099_03940 [Paenibacillus turicensis]|uniref:hypothetical protein n=1 Tax=Paenibacillus turicensis TaxID=160487 RepID=UPI003D27161C